MHASQTATTNEKTNEIKILVVDDEPLLREAISRQLKRQGYLLYTAASGNEAYELVEAQRVNLIISDVRMPNGDGISLLKKVKANYKSIPIILMTGYSATPSYEAFHLGAEAVLQKPFEPSQFLNLVQKSMAPIDRRWQVIGAKLPAIDFSLTFSKSFVKAVEDGDILLGKGGFAVRAERVYLASEKEFHFDISFAPGNITRLAGKGRLIWNRSQDPKPQDHFIGIEISSLTHECLPFWIKFISNLDPTSYVPKVLA